MNIVTNAATRGVKQEDGLDVTYAAESTYPLPETVAVQETSLPAIKTV